MEEIRFVAVDEMEQSVYLEFAALTTYEKEHPLHMLYDYLMQFYGGLREDVLQFFCDSKKVDMLYQSMGDVQEAGARNEWYRRMVRLLQCSAEAGWYELYCTKQDGKPEGYHQYFLNQLAGYAEQGYPVEKVKTIYQECTAAYLLEYRIRCLVKRIPEECRTDAPALENMVCEVKQERETPEEVKSEQTEMLLTILENQKSMQRVLESLLYKLQLSEDVHPEEEITVEEEVVPEELVQGEAEEETEEGTLVVVQESTEAIVKESDGDEEIAKTEPVLEGKEKAMWIAHLFQQIRLKRKSVQLRKLDSSQQLQELVILMQKKKFSPEDFAVVRKMMDKEISLEFLYTVINEEKEPVKQLQQMYEFLVYQAEQIEEEANV